jgi:exosortase A-associated hydrolase 1
LNYSEKAISFACQQEKLVGILAEPEDSAAPATGVIVIVGGPQYRAGSHRQFVQLSRALAAAGYPVLRFDYRGMGDSSGELRDFLQVTPDIAAAIDSLQQLVPSIKHVVLWGLCDAASAALLYCHDTRDARVHGLCLVNPWVRSEVSRARAQVKHYYVDRLRQKEFWIKLLSGRVARSALTGLAHNVATAFSGKGKTTPAGNELFQDRMATAWQHFDAPMLLFLSENDYTAKEFCEYVDANSAWANALNRPNLISHEQPGADHTLSQEEYRLAAEKCTVTLLGKVDALPDRGK